MKNEKKNSNMKQKDYKVVNSNYRKIRRYVAVKGAIEKRPMWELLSY